MYPEQNDPPKFAVIAYGKFGGKEMSYTSDLDIVFIYDDKREGMAEKYARFAQRINSWLNTYSSSGVLYDIDLALRPDGASGLLVSSIDAFRDYQLKRAWTWEHQAITRARFCAGDAEIGNQFEKVRLDILETQRDIKQLKIDVVDMRELKLAAQCAKGKILGDDPHEWIEALMVSYNAFMAEELIARSKGLFRGHSAPNAERMQNYQRVCPEASRLAESAAVYQSFNDRTPHWGLKVDSYAHTTSPIRRWADVHNQMVLLGLDPPEPTESLNALNKATKKY
jgi:uncharacterized protein YfbU (UPF0304 family)